MSRPKYQPGSTVRLAVRREVGVKPAAEYVASRLCLPHNWARGLLAEGRVFLLRPGGERAGLPDAPTRFSVGMELEVNFPADWLRHMRPVEMPLAVLYEDDDLVALNKPAGIAVHPARGHMSGGTLQNGVLFRYGAGADGATPAPAHRLDLDTSGVLVFSRNRAAYRDLVRQFSCRLASKKYLAVVEGTPEWDELVIDVPLGADPENSARGAVVALTAGGKEARTVLRVVARLRGAALVEACPHTGRGHQIRIHLAHCGHPVLGDRDYHPAPERHGAARQALHAAELELQHPRTGEPLRLRAPLPDDIKNLIARLGETLDAVAFLAGRCAF